MRKRLNNLRDDKAAGPDELLPRFLVVISGEICVPLCKLFQKSLEDSVVPADWKDANVCPIYKKK